MSAPPSTTMAEGGGGYSTSLPPTGLTTTTHTVEHPGKPSPPILSGPPAPLPAFAVDPNQIRVPYPSASALGASFALALSTPIPAPDSSSAAPTANAAPATTATGIAPGSTVPSPARFPLPQAPPPSTGATTTTGAGGKRKRTFKVIIVGDAGVGKTCLSFRFCNGRFPEFTEATIGVDFRERSCHIEGETLRVQLWDTAGQERYRQSIVAHYYRNVHAVVFVYDVTSPSSFASLPAWLGECEKHGLGSNSEVPRILIGNKCDLETTTRVCTDNAQMFADRNNMALFETSAKKESEADHVESIFMTLVHHLHRSKAMHVQSERERADQDRQTLLLKADEAARLQEEGWCC